MDSELLILTVVIFGIALFLLAVKLLIDKARAP